MTSEQRPRKTHVLVVDDDEDVRESVLDALESRGLSAAGAADGAEALAYLESGIQRPDVILLDLSMPNMDGYQFREKQLKNPRHASIPVAIFTADGSGEESAVHLHAAACVPKPVKLEALLALIGSVVGNETGVR